MVKYIDIADDIRNKIKQDFYTHGQKLPYEYVLCVSYHCNKETMKKALNILVKEGLIVRRRGAGTFVKDHDPNLGLLISNQGANIQGLTKRYDGICKVNSDIVKFEVIPCDSEIASKLQVDEGSFVYHIIRRRKLEDIIYSLEISYIPISVVKDLRKEHLLGSIYHYIQDELQLKIQSTHKTITGHLSSELEQKYLEMNNNESYIQIEKIGYLSSGVIFEYSLIRQHYKNFEFQTVIVQT